MPRILADLTPLRASPAFRRLWIGNALSAVGSYLTNTNPTFDSRNHGYAKLSTLVRNLPELEVNEVATGNGRSTLFVRPASTSRSRKRGR